MPQYYTYVAGNAHCDPLSPYPDLCSIARIAPTNQKIDMIEYILVI